MAGRSEHERRPFFACDACGIVYARYGPPDECRVCECTAFVEVTPKEYSF